MSTLQLHADDTCGCFSMSWQYLCYLAGTRTDTSSQGTSKHDGALLTVQGDWQGKVHVELSAINHEITTALHEFASQMPSWSTVAAMTTLQASFDF